MTTKRIGTISAWLVAGLTALSLVLSYNSLSDVAYTYGLPDWRSYIWPLAIDGALLVFSLAVLSAMLTKESPFWRWLMVGCFTLATLSFNIVDVGTDKLPPIIVDSLPFLILAVPPLALVLSFETVMAMVRQRIRRQEVTDGIDTLLAERQEVTTEIDKLKTNLTRLKNQIDKKTDELSQLDVELSEVREQVVIAKSGDGIKLTKRQEELSTLIQDGLVRTIPDIQSHFNVSERTAYRYAEPFELAKNGRGV